MISALNNPPPGDEDGVIEGVGLTEIDGVTDGVTEGVGVGLEEIKSYSQSQSSITSQSKQYGFSKS